MNKLEFLPLYVYEFNSSDELLDKTLDCVKNLELTDNERNKRSTTDLFFDNELFDWFESCIKDAKTDIGIPENIELVITSCWANKTDKMQSHHIHTHPNSFLSGIYYLTDDHIGGETIFSTNNIWMKNFEWLQFNINKSYRQTQNFIPQKGTLLLFPSSIHHSVNGVRNNSARYSIAFNTFFSGPIDDSDQKLNRLNLVTKSLRDSIK